MQNEKFNPVAHDDAFVAQMLSDPETKHAYDELEDEYAALNAVLCARREAGLTHLRLLNVWVQQPVQHLVWSHPLSVRSIHPVLRH
jgi:hypothetical protein